MLYYVIYSGRMCQSSMSLVSSFGKSIKKFRKVRKFDTEYLLTTVIAEIFVRVKISYSSACQLSYARNFRTSTVVSETHAYVYGFRVLINFVLSANSTKYTKLMRTKIGGITVPGFTRKTNTYNRVRWIKGSVDRSLLPSAIFLIFTRNRP